MNSRSESIARRAAPPRRRPTPMRKSGRGGTLLGVFIRIALGLALAAGVAFYLLKAGNPYASSGGSKDPAREMAKESVKGRADSSGAEKPRFDFYKILPGVEEPKIQPRSQTPDRPAQDRSPVADKTAVAKAD